MDPHYKQKSAPTAPRSNPRSATISVEPELLAQQVEKLHELVSSHPKFSPHSPHLHAGDGDTTITLEKSGKTSGTTCNKPNKNKPK